MGLFGDPLENCEPGNQWHGCPNCERLKAEISDLRKVVAEGQKRVNMPHEDFDRIAVTSRELNAEIAALREKLVQIHICAENAQYGQLDVWAAINSIVKSAANEYMEGK